MKKLIIAMACSSAIGLASSVMAAPPPKATILHCGCDDNGAGLVFQEISVSPNSKGHAKNHLAMERVESCLNSEGVVADFGQTESDCNLPGSAVMLEGLPMCVEGQAAGTLCGDELVQ